MPTKYKDYPVYTYDEPSTQDDFTGGINTDPSSEHLTKNEMMDCVNMSYLSGALVKRKGAKLMSHLICEDELMDVQGVFLFSNILTHIIVASDGKLYSGIYNHESDIELERLRVLNTIENNNKEFDEEDSLAGVSSIPDDGQHEGYYSIYEDNESNWHTIKYKELIFQNYKPIEAATINNKLYIATGTRIVEVAEDNGVLHASVIKPYLINGTEMTKIGYNYLSPYPELAIASENDTVTTSVAGIKVIKKKDGKFVLVPWMTYQIGESPSDYYFKWEKQVNGIWYTIVAYKDNHKRYINSDGTVMEFDQKDFSTIEVDDADVSRYRVSVTKEFKPHTQVAGEWKWEADTSYELNDIVSVGSAVYKCITPHEFSTTVYDNVLGLFSTTGRVRIGDEMVNKILWEQAFEYESILTMNEKGESGYSYDYIQNSIIDTPRQGTSVLFNNNLDVNDKFITIHSCTKVMADGNKLVFYGDKYNSGEWFKTIIGNPSYITDRGGLSFKTTKNESVIKAIQFQGNIIVFANSESTGGSIHIVTGNGDDYNSGDGYYSPYVRKTINISVSCDNADTVQVCDNILVFKYFNRIYYISASDLSNDVVKVTSCNDRIMSKSQAVQIPWDDNTCVSEVTDKYYSLIWKESYAIDSDGEIYLAHPGMRIKMYYKMTNQMEDNSLTMPWLRDESTYFNVTHSIYVKGKSLFYYNNMLISFNEEVYDDLGEDYQWKVRPKASDLEYPKVSKIIHNLLLYYHRSQGDSIKFDVTVRNESGHKLIDTDETKNSILDLRTIKVGDEMGKQVLRVGTTIMDSKTINSQYMFPCLIADAEIIGTNKGPATFCSLTYQYTTVDRPDIDQHDLYQDIIRIKEI